METEKPLEILVVEDKSYHLENARYYFDQQKEKLAKFGIKLNVYYATTKEEAAEIISGKNLDGVVSDLNFPPSTGGDEHFLGFELGKEYADQKGIPIVFVTDFNVHRYDHKILEEATERWGYRNVFHYGGEPDDIDKEAMRKPGKSKPFALAFFNLLSLIELKSTYKTLVNKNLKEFVSGMYQFGKIDRTEAIEELIKDTQEELQERKFGKDERYIIETLIKYAK